MKVKIIFTNEQNKEKAGFGLRRLIKKAVKAALECENFGYDCTVSVTFTDNEQIREKNREFRGIDSSTDVLSFPMYEFYNGEPEEELEADPESGRVMLGDMILNYDRAREQAADFGHSVERECGFLTVHSVLHLLGYDHEREEDDRLLMRAKEEENLTALGLVRA